MEWVLLSGSLSEKEKGGERSEHRRGGFGSQWLCVSFELLDLKWVGEECLEAVMSLEGLTTFEVSEDESCEAIWVPEHY